MDAEQTGPVDGGQAPHVFGPSLQEAIDQAGGPMHLMWRPNAPTPAVPVVPPEISGWAAEQRSWQEAVSFLELSHHMADQFIDGPDAVKLLSRVTANNFDNFAVGQAKQFIAVTEEGHLIQDGILVRLGEQRFTLIGIGTAHNWVTFHAETGGYDVELAMDLPSDLRQGDPVLFRYQIQGPRAAELLGSVFGETLDDIKFFHFREVELGGRKFNALRHGMAGQAGFEFFGPWEHGAFVKEQLLAAGEPLGIVEIGGLAYYSVGVDSGWFATPLPAVYTAESTAAFRRWDSFYSFEGQFGVHGSFYSPNIEDYYCSPYELGYGRSISFNHDFIGRAALERAKDAVLRTKVTLVWNADDVRQVFGGGQPFVLSYTKNRVEHDGELVGISEYAASSAAEQTIHSLALVQAKFAEPGTELTIQWGQHPGPSAGPDYREEFAAIRATVAPAPYNEYARTAYRA